MKNKILIILILLLTVNLIAEVITDELWLKAVDLKSKSLNIYPTQSQYKTVVKNKKGNVEMTEDIVLAHEEINGQIINTFIQGSSSEGSLTEESKSVQEYLKQPVVVDDMSVFKSETSSDFSLKRLGKEVVQEIECVKYQVNMVSKRDDEEVESNGFVWLDSISGVPLQLSLDVDPNKMVVKSLDVVTYYSISDDGYLITDKVVTDIVISLVFKKMFITNTIINGKYLKLTDK